MSQSPSPRASPRDGLAYRAPAGSPPHSDMNRLTNCVYRSLLVICLDWLLFFLFGPRHTNSRDGTPCAPPGVTPQKPACWRRQIRPEKSGVCYLILQRMKTICVAFSIGTICT